MRHPHFKYACEIKRIKFLRARQLPSGALIYLNLGKNSKSQVYLRSANSGARVLTLILN